MTTRATLAFALLIGCSGPDTDLATDATTDSQTDTDTDTTTDTGTVAVGITGQFGSIVVGEYLRDAEGYDTELYGVAFFQPYDTALTNAAACFWIDSLCVASYPAVGESVSGAPLDVYWWYYAKFVDAGATIDANGTELFRDNYRTYYGYYDFGPVYTGTPAQLSGTGTLQLGGALMPYSGDVFPNTDPIETTSPDPLQRLQLGPTDSVTFTWNASSNGRPFLEAGGQLHGLDDTVGSIELTAQELGLRAPVDVGVALLSRIAHDEVDAAGNQVSVQSRSDQAFFMDYRDEDGWTVLEDGVTFVDDCTEAKGLTPVAAGQYLGQLGGYGNDFDLAYYNDLTGYPTSGNDGVVAIALSKGDTLTASYRQPDGDANLYVLGAPCDLANGIVGQDYEFGPNDEETLTYQAEATGTFYLVLDSGYQTFGAGDFGLVIDVQ
ncbi:MAG: hypothetical protein KTR31_00810 [Myxococcales bacterium]|nr:hypothetical protein [Myxococcales bacterium]